MRKMILSVLVALAVTAFVFGGCKKSQPQPTTPAKGTTAAPKTEKPTPAPVEKPIEK
jgi:PBP1b-binding outer membrane lipoprotein LpoB